MSRVVLVLFALLVCSATASDLRIENTTYRFGFTFEPDTELAYEEAGVGITGSHIPSGKKKPDYGVLVYGSPGMVLSAAEASAIEYADHEAVLSAVDVTDQGEWLEYLTKIMEARGHKSPGDATVGFGTERLKVPYYTWQQELLGRTHHALMYVVKHGDAFIYVQVESKAPLSPGTTMWVTSKLELLPLPEATASSD